MTVSPPSREVHYRELLALARDDVETLKALRGALLADDGLGEDEAMVLSAVVNTFLERARLRPFLQAQASGIR